MIEPSNDDMNIIKDKKYNFVKIAQIANLQKKERIDVIGILWNIGDIQTFHSKSTGKELKKREVIVIDETG